MSQFRLAYAINLIALMILASTMLLGLALFELSRLPVFKHKFRLWRAQQRAAKPSSD